jgi:cobalt/nickel transport system ATP-binding protein
LVQVTNLRVQYAKTDETPVLQDISFSVSPGERVALIGSNGAGKSTLLLTLIGVIKPWGGTMVIGDIPVKQEGLRELRRKTGMVFQNPEDQLFMPTVAEDIGFGLRNYGFDEKTIESRTRAILERLGISHLENRMSHKLSGGEKRLAALAGVLVMEPSLLLMDEPSSFLDPRSRRVLITVLDSLSQTMIIATHDVDLALALCSRTLFLKAGRVCAEGPTEELVQDQALLERWGL